jgi:hypothetical protein
MINKGCSLNKVFLCVSLLCGATYFLDKDNNNISYKNNKIVEVRLQKLEDICLEDKLDNCFKFKINEFDKKTNYISYSINNKSINSRINIETSIHTNYGQISIIPNKNIKFINNEYKIEMSFRY